MSAYDKLKTTVDQVRQSLKKLQPIIRDLPSEKFGSGYYTVEEAINLFDELVESLEYVLKEKTKCIRYITEPEMNQLIKPLNMGITYLTNSAGREFVAHVEQLILLVRPFDMLLMEKMDERRYSQINDMEESLITIKTQEKHIADFFALSNKCNTEIMELHNNIKSKIEEFDENIDMNIKKSRKLDALTREMQQYHQGIKNIFNQANEKQTQINGFVELIQAREKDIAVQKVLSEKYEKDINTYKEEHKQIISTHKKERDGLVQEARELIEEARNALQHKTAEVLSAAFHSRQNQVSNIGIKMWWLGMVVCASLSAIGLGFYTISEWVDKDNDVATILLRSSFMLITLGIAGFSARQYSKNKTIEEDYAYKTALIRSYPGLVATFSHDDKLREQYVHKLLAEVLQDPQRIRVSPKHLHAGAEEKKDILKTIEEILSKYSNADKKNPGD